jgi:flotillin
MGLELDLLKIQNVTDDVGYLKSIGRIAGADLRKRAVSAEVSAQAEAAVQKAQNWMASETARYDADLNISRSDMDKRIVDARTKREAMIQEARGQVFAEIAQVRAEIERQKARAIQVQRKLEADVVQPAEAARQKKEEESRGAAASILERGKAEAMALKKLVEAYKSKGGDAREILALQSVLPMALDISGARFPLKIGKVTVLPGGGDSLAKGLIGANEQLKSASGIDLGSMASRLMPPKPAAK